MRARQDQRAKYDAVGMKGKMGAERLEHVEEQMNLFRKKLEEFAKKYKDQIKKDPVFRREFQIMCAKIGVDPLASTKGFWAELLGVGNFYVELGIQVVDACVSTRSENGGLIEMPDLIRAVVLMRGSNAVSISPDDVERAVKQLKVLGSGFNTVQAGPRRMVISVPVELNRDHTLILHAAQETGGWVTLNMMQSGIYKWPRQRVVAALRIMLEEGMCWEDKGCKKLNETKFWFPSIWRHDA